MSTQKSIQLSHNVLYLQNNFEWHDTCRNLKLMNPLPSPDIWKKISLFGILLSIAVVSILSNTQNLLAKPNKVKNEFHRNCNFCHLPYGSIKNLPLWDENSQFKSFSPQKESESINQIHSSKLCLSCHDGTIASDQAINMNEGEKISSGFDLDKNHPVSIDYNTALSRKGLKKLHHPSTINPLKLYNGKVECATCHNIHQSFQLRMSKKDLCFRCHNM